MANVIELDGISGEVIERDFTAEEIQQRQAEAAAAEAAAAKEAAAEAARIQAVQDAQAELKQLGLSDAAVATISGYPYPYSPAA